MWPLTSKVGLPLIFTFYLLTVAQELPATALGLLLARDLSLSPADSSAFYAAIYVPWTIKPVYAFISDNVPIFGFRRRPWLMLCCVGATGACVMQALLGTSQHTILIYSILLAVFAAAAECMADTYSVEIANRHALQMSTSTPTTTTTPLDEPLISSATLDKPIIPTHIDVVPTEHEEPSLTLTSVLTMVAAPPLITHGMDRSHGIHHHTTGDGYVPLTDTTTPSIPPSTSTSTPSPEVTNQINTMKAAIQAECSTIRTMGSVTASALSILMLYLWNGSMGRRFIIGCAGIVYLTSIIPVIFIYETRVQISHFGLSTNSMIESKLAQTSYKHLLLAKIIAVLALLRLYFLPALFLFIYSSMPTSEDAFSTYLYDNFSQFMDWQQGLYNFVGLTGSLCGHMIYWRFLTHLNIKLVFIIATILAALASSLDIVLALHYENHVHLAPRYFVPISSFLSSIFGAIAIMPPIVLAALASHQHAIKMEGSMFALYASTQHVGTLLAAVFSSQLTTTLGVTSSNWSSLWKLILICNCLALAPLFLIPLLKHVDYNGPQSQTWLWNGTQHLNDREEEHGQIQDLTHDDHMEHHVLCPSTSTPGG